MSDLVKKDEQALLTFLRGREEGLELPNPFERDIYLFDTRVAGTTHIENIEEIGERLNIGDKVLFYREPDNSYDQQAIRVENLNNQKIGYIPRQDNIIFSRLMDAGKMLFGKITSKELRGKWLKLEMKIYLHEN